jgi:hypothetical protein
MYEFIGHHSIGPDYLADYAYKLLSGYSGAESIPAIYVINPVAPATAMELWIDLNPSAASKAYQYCIQASMCAGTVFAGAVTATSTADDAATFFNGTARGTIFKTIAALT